ncbi:RNA-binding protein 39 isoform X2 [Aplysia californica]|uniref:RNA-binding protein 39 isoform X2 n=1 Tax=Aplysia californica TaxID=6500 RepID=A0ABM1W3S0_APLCA|nr:RNA-binding protein 39 isoform X2 [Aplysia californica]
MNLMLKLCLRLHIRKRKKRSRSRERSKERKRSRSREKTSKVKDRRSKSRERSPKYRDRRSRSRSKDRRRREKERDRRRSRSRDRDHERRRRSRSPRRRRSRSAQRTDQPHADKERTDQPHADKGREPELTPEERDIRTVFCMQLSARIRPRDLEEFFSSVGKVRDVRLITDNKTRRSKGISYVEFADPESVPLALALAGQKLLGVPILVQPSQAEKNRAQPAVAPAPQKASEGPLRLYVGSLHFNITEDMLRGIFEPFGKIIDIKIMRDHETQRSLGFGFISFANADDAKKALDQLNGFELAGRPMKVGHVTERSSENGQGGGQGGQLDTDEMDRAGIDLGATGRLQLMAKLAEGTGFEIPPYAASALNSLTHASVTIGGTPVNPQTPQPLQAGVQSNIAAAPGAQPQAPATSVVTNAPPIATQCFMLSNMFEPLTETRTTWDQEIRDDVIDECNKHGGVLHIYVDKNSPQGNVYVKCPSISAAVASVNALHGRYFAGRVITAAYVPLPNYHNLFAESVRANQLLMPSSQALSASYQTGFMAQPPMR